MVQSAPPRTLQTFDGMIQARLCSPENGCVLTQVMAHLRVDADDTWYVAYWDPNDPMNNAMASGAERCEAEAIGRMIEAITSIANARS